MTEELYVANTKSRSNFRKFSHIFPSNFSIDDLRNWIPIVLEKEDLYKINIDTNVELNCFVINVNTMLVSIVSIKDNNCIWSNINMSYGSIREEYLRWKLAQEKDDTSFCLRDDNGRIVPFTSHIQSYSC